MAPWGLGLCEGLLCPSMSECLSVSLFLVGGLSGSSRERKGFLCCSLGREMRYVHSAPAGTSCLFWHPQYTAHRDAVSLCKEKGKFCWQQGQWFPPWHSQPAVMLAMGVHAHPQGQGFVTDLCWSRICFIPSLIFCVAEDTGQFKFIEDWGPRDALHGRALYLHFHPSSVLWDWKLCLTPCRLPPMFLQIILASSVEEKTSSEKDSRFIYPQFIVFQPTFSTSDTDVGGFPFPMHVLALLPIPAI